MSLHLSEQKGRNEFRSHATTLSQLGQRIIVTDETPLIFPNKNPRISKENRGPEQKIKPTRQQTNYI
jgi:hypothetical protein